MKPFAIASIACAVALVTSSPAQADEKERTTYDTLEQATVFADHEMAPNINGAVTRFLYGPVGLYSFFYVDRDYAEALIGPAYAPTKWMVLSAGAGIEHADEGSWRVGGALWMGGERFTSLTIVEMGASGFWARTEFAWRPGPATIGIGILGDLALGIGPRLEARIPRTPIQLWGAPLYEWREERAVGTIGIRLDL